MLRVLRKCSIVICFLMMCPRRSNFAVPPPIQKLKPVNINAPSEELEAQSSENINSIVKIKAEKSKDEPGFDLTDEEINKFNIWPQGVIPYYIDVFSYSDKVLRDRIRGFLNAVSSVTSLNFLEMPSPPKDEESRWVFFINRRGLLGCSDHSIKKFTNKGVQKVILGYDCMSTGGELAEAVLAIAGVSPQHNSPNRDEYIHIAEQNIMPDKKHLFTKLNNNEWLFHDIDYDFSSAGHYHSHRYSINGQATIQMQEKYQDYAVGESKLLSAKDTLKIKMLYNFISKRKQNITDCHKLFEPGTKFNKYQPSNVPILPRKKSNKYTGQHNDIIESNVEELSVLKETEKADSKQVKTDTDDVKSIKDEDQELSQNLDETENDELTNKHKNLKYEISFKKDPLAYLSDYKSSEDGRLQLKLAQKSLAFGKPGKHRSYAKITEKEY